MRQARVKQDYRLSTVQAHTGRQYTKLDWRPAPDDGHVCELLDYRETAVSIGSEVTITDVTALDTEITEVDNPVLSVDLESMTKAELQELAREAGVSGVSRKSKAKLIEALKDD